MFTLNCLWSFWLLNWILTLILESIRILGFSVLLMLRFLNWLRREVLIITHFRTRKIWQFLAFSSDLIYCLFCGRNLFSVWIDKYGFVLWYWLVLCLISYFLQESIFFLTSWATVDWSIPFKGLIVHLKHLFQYSRLGILLMFLCEMRTPCTAVAHHGAAHFLLSATVAFTFTFAFTKRLLFLNLLIEFSHILQLPLPLSLCLGCRQFADGHSVRPKKIESGIAQERHNRCDK